MESAAAHRAARPARSARPRPRLGLRTRQAILVVVLLLGWHVVTTPGLLPSWVVGSDSQAAFFFGEPWKVVSRIWTWFRSGTIWPHLATTLAETLLAFIIGTILGLGAGVWLALAPAASSLLSPFITAANAMPRVVLAPIFAMWFGLGITSKVALAVTLVFFLVFFNAFHGVRSTPAAFVLNSRMLGATQRQLVWRLYLPSAAGWVFSSLHNAVGIAFVGAVIGEYLGSSRGVGYLILEAEGSFDVNGVFAGIAILTVCAILLDNLVSLVERRFLRWQPRPVLGGTA